MFPRCLFWQLPFLGRFQAIPGTDGMTRATVGQYLRFRLGLVRSVAIQRGRLLVMALPTKAPHRASPALAQPQELILNDNVDIDCLPQSSLTRACAAHYDYLDVIYSVAVAL